MGFVIDPAARQKRHRTDKVSEISDEKMMQDEPHREVDDLMDEIPDISFDENIDDKTFTIEIDNAAQAVYGTERQKSSAGKISMDKYVLLVVSVGFVVSLVV